MSESQKINHKIKVEVFMDKWRVTCMSGMFKCTIRGKSVNDFNDWFDRRKHVAQNLEK